MLTTHSLMTKLLTIEKTLHQAVDEIIISSLRVSLEQLKA